MSNSTKLAHSLLRQLIQLGVSDFVISPGSRNAPLTIALSEAASKQIIDLHVKIDERGAAFFALGIAKASNNYVAVICTSGTAAANFYPAALEAFHSSSKLLMITADRPEILRKTGANQTTDQVGIYKLIKTHDISSEIELEPLLNGKPIHLNIQFSEPLISEEKNDWLASIKIKPVKYRNNISGKLETTTGVLIIGHDNAGYTDDEINSFVDKLNWPVIAENPISFSKAHPHVALYLSDPKIREALAPENIIVIGRTTLSRSTNEFIKLAKNLIVIDPRVANIDKNRKADLLVQSLPIDVVSESTDISIWQKSSDLVAVETEQIPWSEQAVIKSICGSLTSMSALFVGSSRPVRDIEAFTKFQSGVLVFANRGLAGIDGNISTVLGIAKKHQITNAIMGDLTFLHDISALTNAGKENLRIFVIDNNGGGIFSTLPQASSDGFEQVFGTPHNLDLVKVISGFDISVSRVSDLARLELITKKPINGFEVVVVEVPSRETNAQMLKEITQRVSSAVRMGINLA